MIAKIVEVLEKIDKRQKFVEVALAQMLGDFNEIRNSICDKSGFISYRGAISSGVEEIKEALESPAILKLEEVEIDVHFSQAFYMAAMPGLEEKVKDALKEAQVTKCLDLLKQYKRVDDLLDKSELKMSDIEERMHKLRSEAGIGYRDVTKHATELVTKEQSDATEELKTVKSRVEKAIDRLELVLKSAEADRAEAQNVILGSKRATKLFKGK